jgi:hypothetical protein
VAVPENDSSESCTTPRTDKVMLHAVSRSSAANAAIAFRNLPRPPEKE